MTYYESTVTSLTEPHATARDFTKFMEFMARAHFWSVTRHVHLSILKMGITIKRMSGVRTSRQSKIVLNKRLDGVRLRILYRSIELQRIDNCLQLP